MVVAEALLKGIMIRREIERSSIAELLRLRQSSKERESGHYVQANKKQCQCYNCKRYGNFSYECYNRPFKRVVDKSNFTSEGVP